MSRQLAIILTWKGGRSASHERQQRAAVGYSRSSQSEARRQNFCSLLLADELDRADVVFATLMIAAFAIATAVICRAPGV